MLGGKTIGFATHSKNGKALNHPIFMFFGRESDQEIAKPHLNYV